MLSQQFQIQTDHALLQWLSAQRMEGLLCWLALVLQECSFTIVHRKGTLNDNADSLSRRDHKETAAPTATTFVHTQGTSPQTL